MNFLEALDKMWLGAKMYRLTWIDCMGTCSYYLTQAQDQKTEETELFRNTWSSCISEYVAIPCILSIEDYLTDDWMVTSHESHRMKLKGKKLSDEEHKRLEDALGILEDLQNELRGLLDSHE